MLILALALAVSIAANAIQLARNTDLRAQISKFDGNHDGKIGGGPVGGFKKKAKA